jgi:hypothetical protein
MRKVLWFVVFIILLVGFVLSYVLQLVVTTTTINSTIIPKQENHPKNTTSSSNNATTVSTIDINPHGDALSTGTTSNRIWNITLLVQLRGELGNHLALLANARISQIIAQTKYPNLHIHIIGQHQNHPKWLHAYHDIQSCFPQLYKDIRFDGGILARNGSPTKITISTNTNITKSMVQYITTTTIFYQSTGRRIGIRTTILIIIITRTKR